MARIPSPASRGVLMPRLSVFDLMWTLCSPLLALYFRDTDAFSQGSAATIACYTLTCASCSLIACLMFRIGDGVESYFSVHDGLVVLKAVALAEFMICMLLFSLTRLEGIPRSVPIIHALLLMSGLVGIRMFERLFENARSRAIERLGAEHHIIMIGSNGLSSLYIKALEVFSRGGQRVVAMLDDRPHIIGRAIDGIRVVGMPTDLEVIVAEFAVHGIRIDRVVVGGEANLLSDKALEQVQSVCRRCDIDLSFVPRLVDVGGVQRFQEGTRADFGDTPTFVPSGYFHVKRFIDVFAALILLILLLPLFAGVGLSVLFDLGSPIFFWQRRLGQGHRPFLVYKFRTLRPPFDCRGQRLPENERISWLGQLLRETSLDELPQLLNVLVGDMSLIGPRPLLPQDQPSNPTTVRLSVRPGITGWAQVNGAKLLTAEEKDELDEWYIRNASPWLDLRILFMTVTFILRGPERLDSISAKATGAAVGRQMQRNLAAKRLVAGKARQQTYQGF